MSALVYLVSTIKQISNSLLISIQLYCRAKPISRYRLCNMLLCFKPINLLISEENLKRTVRHCLPRMFAYIIDNCALIPICFLDAQNNSKDTSANDLRQIKKDKFY